MTAERSVLVDRLGSAADGIADLKLGGRIAIPNALPGETFACPATEGAPWTLVGSPSPDRVSPACPHFGECGGCSAQHMSPALYREWKRELLLAALRQHGLTCDVDPLIEVPARTRRRASFSVAKTSDVAPGDWRLGFHASRSDRVIGVDQCRVLTPAIIAALPVLTALARTLGPWPREARIAVADLDGGLDIAIEGMTPRMSADTRVRIAEIAAMGRLARITANSLPVVTRARVTLPVGTAHVALPPGAFFQAAREAECAMTQIVTQGLSKARRVADLFCGVGTFTFALAAKARVIAIDSDRELLTALVDAARKTPGLKPIETRARDLFKDPLSAREIDVFDTVVLDPPRAGARAQCEAFAKSRLSRIVYVSCNPATLARDLSTLVSGGFRIQRIVPIDQFVYSSHLEAVAVLHR